jgi:Protein of unknown function (DUF1570)
MPRPAALLLALFLAPIVLAARPPEPPRPTDKWISLQVDEFHFVSNVSSARTLDIARDLLRMRAAIGAVTHLKVRSALPTTVFIFANHRGFAPYRDAVLQTDSDHIVGVFSGTETGNFILLRSDLDEMDRTVFHELTHYFVRNTTTGLPLWISEGIAEYYSTFGTSGNDVHIGRPIAEHVRWLRATHMIPLRDLFATTSASPIYNEGTRNGVFYAQSWALFHYLMSDDERRAKFSRFLQLVGAHKTADEAFETAFAMKYSDLEQELRKYVRRNAFTYVRHSLDALPVVEPPKPEPMAHGDVLFALGHLLTHSDDANGAIAEAICAPPSKPTRRTAPHTRTSGACTRSPGAVPRRMRRTARRWSWGRMMPACTSSRRSVSSSDSRASARTRSRSRSSVTRDRSSSGAPSSIPPARWPGPASAPRT